MDRLAGREGRVRILHSGHRRTIEHGVGGEVEAIEVPVFGRDRHEFLAASRLDSGRTGNIPVMPVAGNNLEVAFVRSGLCIEHDDGSGIEVEPSRGAVAKSGAGFPPGTYKRPVAGSKV